MEKIDKTVQQPPEPVLSTKEKALEFTATAMCFVMLLGFLLKVLFF